MINAALGAALLAIGVGGVVATRDRMVAVGLRLQAAGAALLGVYGFVALATGASAGAEFTSRIEPRFGVDGLTALVLGILGLVAAPACLHAASYLGVNRRGRAIAGLLAVFIVVLAGVVCARDPLTLLTGWELMTVVPALMILIAHDANAAARKTVFRYVAITHLGGVGTWIAVLLLADAGAIGDPSRIASGSALQVAIALAAIVGMGTKAGLMPFHAWLPLAHPVAPAPASALMSGVMIKVAVYGLVRVLIEWIGLVPMWIGLVVLGLGAFSAVGGIVYALFQRDVKQLLAWSSVENVGIIVLGLGACLLLRGRGATDWAALALGAALLHAVNHALFKALLFLGAGTFERAAGSLGLDSLGGLLRRMPWAGGAFLVGALAIIGLPPLNGFASEWLTMQALLRVSVGDSLAAGLAGVLALAALAATAALGLVCFVKVIGLVLLGRPRRQAIEAAGEPAWSARAALLGLAVGCGALGLAPGLLAGQLVGLAPWAAAAPAGVGLTVPTTGSLPTGGIAAVLLVVTCGLFVSRGRRAAAPAPTWACGQPVDSVLEWTSAGFTKPLRLTLELLLRPEREVRTRTAAGVVLEVTYTGRVPHLIDERMYRPVERGAQTAARHARRLQGGRLGTYATYLIGLVVVLLAAARLGVFG